MRLRKIAQFVAIGIERAGGDLVQQRLPQMRIAAVDQSHFDSGIASMAIAQASREFKPARAAADHDTGDGRGSHAAGTPA